MVEREVAGQRCSILQRPFFNGVAGGEGLTKVEGGFTFPPPLQISFEIFSCFSFTVLKHSTLVVCDFLDTSRDLRAKASSLLNKRKRRNTGAAAR